MADETNPAQAGESSAGTQNTDSTPQQAIPYARFQEVNEARKRAEAEVERIKSETAAAQDKALKEQGKYRELYEKVMAELEVERQHRERADALGKTISATNQKRIEQIPEDMRPVIPTDYPPEKLSEWLDNNASRLTKAPPPPRDGGKVGEAGQPQIKVTEQVSRMAQVANQFGYNIKPEALAARQKAIEEARQRKPNPDTE